MSALRYVGAGAWIPLVPARDLTEDEAAEHADAIAATAAAGHILYETVTETPRRVAKKESSD